MVNLFGNAELIGSKLGTLGGYITFKYGAIFALGTALWSILALSATLAGEARRGSLDFVAAAPFGKRRIALEKLAAHLTLLWLAMLILAVSLTFSSNAFGDAALGDSISPLSRSASLSGSASSRCSSAGSRSPSRRSLAAPARPASPALRWRPAWIMTGLDVRGPLLALSPFPWTSDHVALVGEYDWPPLGSSPILGVVFLAIGVELFERRDLGVTAGLSLPAAAGRRSSASTVPTAGRSASSCRARSPGASGSACSGSSTRSLVRSMLADQLGQRPSSSRRLQHPLPGHRPRIGRRLAAALCASCCTLPPASRRATFVSKWASDETDGRLEMLLATPLARAGGSSPAAPRRWSPSSG